MRWTSVSIKTAPFTTTYIGV